MWLGVGVGYSCARFGRTSMIAFRKLALLTTLYIAQGLPFGFFSQALPAMMRQQGISLQTIGLAPLLALPWAAKFLWAPFVDRYGRAVIGRRRSWLIPLQVATVVTLLLLACLDPKSSLAWLLVGVFVTNLLAATQDIATDGLAVELLTENERGLGNGVQVAGFRVGMIVGGGALLILFDRLGWAGTFNALAVLMLLTTVPVLSFEEPVQRVRSTPNVREAVQYFLRDRGARRWAAVLGLYKFGEYLGTSMLRPFFVDEGLSLGDLGILLGTVGFAAGLVGALFGGWCVTRLGRRRSLLWFGALQSFAVASYAVCVGASGQSWRLYAPVVFEHLTSGMATAALFTLMMDRCRPDQTGTDYTLQASWVVLATMVASALGGTTATRLDFGPNFILGGVVSLAAVALAWRWYED